MIFHLNTEKWTIENNYVVSGIPCEKFENCIWKGVVNSDKSLFAIYLKHLSPLHNSFLLYVYSMKNGLQVSSRQVVLEGEDIKIQFLESNNLEVLVLYSLDKENERIIYMIMDPYETAYECVDEYDIQEFLPHGSKVTNYTIVEPPTSQYSKVILSCGGKIKLIDFIVPEKIIKMLNELYDQMKRNPNLAIYSSFKVIRDSYEGTIKNFKKDDGIIAVGKKLKWKIITFGSLFVYNKTEQDKYGICQIKQIDQLQNEPILGLKRLKLDIQGLIILDNDDLVCYDKSGIIIFGFNETSSNIVLKYFYHDVRTFLNCKSLPSPNLNLLNNLDEDISCIISELLHARKYIIEMSDEMINNAIIYNEREMLRTCLYKLYELLTNDIVNHYRFCSFITKYLQMLNLEFNTYYSRFISITLIVPNPCIHKTYFSDRTKMVGYTDHPNTVQVYKHNDFQNVWNSILNFCCSTSYKKAQSTRVISLIIPYLGFTKYPPKYNFWSDLLKPKGNQFVAMDDKIFYECWNAEALLNFKWNTFGKYYFFLMWGSFSTFLLTFGIVTTLSSSVISNDGRDIALLISIILGLIHIVHEIRQIIWDWTKYITDPWNWFDEPVVNVDPNNPWNLVTEYKSVSPNGQISSEPILIQQPEDSLNQFSTYETSLFAMYLFLTGDSSALSSWSYKANPFMAILLTLFSFLVVIYLMNLFIGLLNLEIEENRSHSLFLLQKAKVLAEIEMFLLLPNQRRWRHWFPDVIYYEAPIEDVKQLITKIDYSLPSNSTPHISNELRRLADMEVLNKGPMTKADCDNLMTKSDCKDLMNRFMTRDDWKNSKIELLNEIRILLDENFGGKGKENFEKSDSNDDLIINIKDN
ncbi:12056_t:CDS:2 [Funneliformis caledonium]|uniref:12056_t:CDS:1 n=1 Tax=Funneliformis caledonium TaxID=1117310 RepID=A0A9N9EHB1_9GLOM|nr:12056_t:CDS:2 [Funneliformis caledonium]